jgi:hypothetical protein
MSVIQIKSPALTIKAGKRAMMRIRERGLAAADVGIIPGAAGGPKALGIQGLDLALFGEWLPRAPRERSLIGASIGSWRFASACLPDPVEGIERLGKLYNEQSFAKGVTMAEVTRSARRAASGTRRQCAEQPSLPPEHHDREKPRVACA